MGSDDEPWAYDNERRAHEVELAPFSSTPRPVTNRAFAEFVEAGGYRDDAAGSRRVATGAKARASSTRSRGSPRAGGGARRPLRPSGAAAAGRAGAARLLVRGRRVRALGRQAAADGGRVGAGRSAGGATRGVTSRSPAAPTWRRQLRARAGGHLPGGRGPWDCRADGRRRVGVDGERLPAYPGFRTFPYREYSEVFFGSEYKVLRGGSWATHPAAVRTTFRNWDYPIRRQIFAGFRWRGTHDVSGRVVVLGGGAVGEAFVAALRRHDEEVPITLVESHLVGGECSYYACMPSKALLRAPRGRGRGAPRARGRRGGHRRARPPRQVFSRRDEVDRRPTTTPARCSWLAGSKASSSCAGAGRVAEAGRRRGGRRPRIALRRGSWSRPARSAAIPPIDGSRHGRVLDEPRRHDLDARSRRA